MRPGRPAVGVALFPDLGFLRAARRVIEAGTVELFEVSPELLWLDATTPDDPRRAALLDLRRATGTGSPGGPRWVAHGLMAALGEPDLPAEDAAAWAARLRADQAAFGFAWWSEHLGFARAAGLEASLPLPLPDTPEAVQAAAARARWLGEVTGRPVLLEPVACPFRLAAPARELALVDAVASAAGCGVLLDLHNAWAGAQQGGLPLEGWLDGLDLARVVEVHVAGGTPSDPAWLASGAVHWLDTHDAAVPEPVWAALERALPRCPNLEAVVLERLPGSLGPAQVPAWERELARLAELLRAHGAARGGPPERAEPPAAAETPAGRWPGAAPEVTVPVGPDGHGARANAALVRALHAPDPAVALAGTLASADGSTLAAAARAALAEADPDGLRLAGLLVKKLRFERLLAGAPALRAPLDADPAALVARFRRYDAAVSPRTRWPREEAADFAAFEAADATRTARRSAGPPGRPP